MAVDVVLPPAEGREEDGDGDEPDAPGGGVFAVLDDRPHHEARELAGEGEQVHQHLHGHHRLLLVTRKEACGEGRGAWLAACVRMGSGGLFIPIFFCFLVVSLLSFLYSLFL